MLGLQENAFKSVPNQTTNTYGAMPSGLQQTSGALSGLGTLGQGLFGNSGLFGSNGTMSGLAGLFGGNGALTQSQANNASNTMSCLASQASSDPSQLMY
jgi:hypothetical protein